MKRLISILLSLMLIMTSLPMIASADGAAETQTVDITVTDSASLNTETGEVCTVEDKGSSYHMPSNGSKSVGYIVYRFNLPMGAVGVEIDSATLTYHESWDWASTDSFFRVPYGTWTSKSDVTQSYINQVASRDTSDNYVGSVDVGSMGSSREWRTYTVDVTEAVQEAVADGEAKVALSWHWNTTWYGQTREVATERHSTNKPTLSVSYRVTGVPAMMFQSVSVNNGDTIGVNDGISFTYSNPVDPASVTPADFTVKNFADEAIAISDSDIVVSGNTVTLKKTWDSYSAYTVSLSGIADVTGQTVSESSSVSFKTSINTANIESNEIMIKDSQWWTDDHVGSGYAYYEGAAQNSSNGYTFPRGADYKQNGYTVFRFNLPQISEGKVLSSAVLSYWHKYDSAVTDKWFAVPFGTWTEPSTTRNDEYVAAVESAASNPDYVGTYSFGGGGSQHYNAVVDVTGAISKTLAAGESGVALTFHGGDSNGRTWTRFICHELNAGYEPTLIINTVPAEIAAVSSTPEKGGKMTDMNSSVEMVLATTLEDGYANSDYVKLINNATGLAVGAQVDYDKTTGKLTVTPDSDLDQRTLYKVVLKAGIKDIYGTTLSADKTINAFTTGVSLEYSAIKFTSETTPVYDSCATIDSYTAGSSVTAVAKIANSTSKDYNAVMIIALYDENDELIDLDVYGGASAVPANEEVQFSKAITVPAGKSGTTIKAFIWDGFDYIRPMLEHNSINQAQ